MSIKIRKAIAIAQEPKKRIITIEPVMNSFQPKVNQKTVKIKIILKRN
jgi:hypothetical protein